MASTVSKKPIAGLLQQDNHSYPERSRVFSATGVLAWLGQRHSVERDAVRSSQAHPETRSVTTARDLRRTG